MSDSDLIERLQLVKDIFDGHAEGDLHPYREQSEAVGEAITALSPVLPEEVAELLEQLELCAPDTAMQLCDKSADLIERLERENAALCDENAWLEKAQQRIEELEAEDEISYALLQTYERQRDEARELVRVAKCPNDQCQDGAIPHGPTPGGDWEWEQCQWCDEAQRIRGMSDE